MLRTTKQQKTICKACPIAKTADLIGDTHVLLIVRDLLSKPKRFGDIEKSLSTVSSRTITKKLQFLEERGLIEKKTINEKPPRVEYSLTKQGKALHTIIESMNKYGERYL